MKRKNDVFSEVVVGAFMLAVLGLLAYFTIVISGVDLLQGRQKVLARVTFAEVGGLKDHDSVMYRGTKVGAVECIAVTPSNLVVSIEIDRAVKLREGYRIAVANLSMLGGNYLVLEEGEGRELDLATTAFKGETPTDWMRDVSRIAHNLSVFTEGGELKSIVTNIEVASVRIRTIAERLERGEGTLGRLMAADDSLYTDIHRTVTNVAAVAERVNRGEGTVGRLLSKDETVYRDLKKSIANVSELSDRLRRGEGALGRLLAKDDPLYGEIRSAATAFRAACESVNARETIASANRLLASLNTVADRLQKGEGTLGKLLADGELHREVQGLVKDVRQVIDNYRDTTPISTFGSLIMGGL